MKSREWSLVLLIIAIALLMGSFLKRSWERRESDFNVFVDPGFVLEDTNNVDTFTNYMIRTLLREYLLASREESVTVRVLAPLYERGLYTGFGEIRSFWVKESATDTSIPFIRISRFINKYSSKDSPKKYSSDLWKASRVYFLTPSQKVWFFVSQEALSEFAIESPEVKWTPIFVTHEDPDDSIYKVLNESYPNTAIIYGDDPDSMVVLKSKELRGYFSENDNKAYKLDNGFYRFPFSEIARMPDSRDSGLIVILFDMSGIYKNVFAEITGIKGLVKFLKNRYIFQPEPLDTFNIMVLGFGSETVLIEDTTVKWRDFENDSTHWIDSLAVKMKGKRDSTLFSKTFDTLRNEFNRKDMSRYRTVHIWFITDGIPGNDSAFAWTKSVSSFLDTLKNKNSRIRTLDIYFMIPADLPLSQKERKDRIHLLNTIDSVLTKNTKQSGRLRAFVKVQVIDLFR